jgi:cytochrome c oxidase subunit 1
MSTMVQARAGRSRTCEVTGLGVDWHAETLIKVDAVVAVVNFLIGLIAAFGVVMTRWQAVHFLPADLFYRFLTLHGLNRLIFFIIFFEMAVLYFAGSVLLSSRLPAPRPGWVAFGLMLLGMLRVNVMVVQGKADVLFTSYPPLQAHPLYYLGIILFAVGALVVTPGWPTRTSSRISGRPSPAASRVSRSACATTPWVSGQRSCRPSTSSDVHRRSHHRRSWAQGASCWR